MLKASPIFGEVVKISDNSRSKRLVLITAELLGEVIDSAVERPLNLLGLTQAETRVAVSIGSGRSPSECADDLAISVATVRVHLRRIYEKLGISRQAELARIVTQLKRL